MMSRDSIVGMVGGILSEIETKSRESYREVAENAAMKAASEAIRAANPERFYFGLTYPMNQQVDGLFAQEFPETTPDFRFLFKHSDFVKSHLRGIFEKFEGSACCADKTRTLMRALAVFLRDGKPIAFDYAQEYTFHLPARVLKSHDEIFTFFKAVQRLYYGRFDMYVEALSVMHARMASGGFDESANAPGA